MNIHQTSRHPISLTNADCQGFYRRPLRQRGAATIEYALLSALIALAILGAVSSTGSALGDLWTNIANKVGTAFTPG